MNILRFLITIVVVTSAQTSWACQFVGYPETRPAGGMNNQISRIVMKTNETCASKWDLKSTAGRLNYRSIEIFNLENDGTVITKLQQNGDNDFTISFKPTVPGAHWVKFVMRQYPKSGPSFDNLYTYELKVDIPYKDPGSFD